MRAFEAEATGQSFSALNAIRRALPMRLSPDTAWFQMHDPARLIRARLGPQVWQDFLSFAVVRNPYDHALSHYLFLKDYRYGRVRRKVRAMRFDDYLDWRLSARMHPFRSRVSLFARLPDQAHFVTDGEGRLIVDRILRFETLARDLGDVCAALDMPQPQLGHARRTDRPETDLRPMPVATAERIERLYARDFDLFGYDRTAPPLPVID